MGDVTPNMSIFIPSSGEELYRASYSTGQGNIDLHRHTGAPSGGLQLISDSLEDGAITPDKLSIQVRQSANYIANYGISYSNGVFSVTSSDGSAFSASNRGYVTFQNHLNPGQLITLTETTNQSFLDAASGSSQIAGNLFGRASGIDSTQDVTFYLYAVINDAQDHIALMLCPLPCMDVAPTSTNIGMPSNPIADQENSFWSLENITVGDYDGNPAVELGCFRMRKTGGANNDWTVQGLNSSDGIGACSCSSGGVNPPSPTPLTIGSLNLSFVYNSGFFEVSDSEGNPLSLTDIAYVTLASNVTASTLVQAPVYSNRGFRDSTSGSGSDISGNLFGKTLNVDWPEDLPVFLYAVLSTSADSVGFAISLNPAANISPSLANSGTIGLATANVQQSFYYLARDHSGNNVIPTSTPGGTPTDFVNLYAQQPCLRLGAFRMRKTGTTNNDWTVQNLSVSGGDGMGKTHSNTTFIYPTNQFGSPANSYFLEQNTAVSPVFSAGSYEYQLDSNGLCRIDVILTGCSVAGTSPGGEYLTLTTPYVFNGSNPFGLFVGAYNDSSASTGYIMLGTTSASNQALFSINAATSNLLQSSIDINDAFQGQYIVKMQL